VWHFFLCRGLLFSSLPFVPFDDSVFVIFWFLVVSGFLFFFPMDWMRSLPSHFPPPHSFPTWSAGDSGVSFLLQCLFSPDFSFPFVSNVFFCVGGLLLHLFFSSSFEHLWNVCFFPFSNATSEFRSFFFFVKPPLLVVLTCRSFFLFPGVDFFPPLCCL